MNLGDKLKDINQRSKAEETRLRVEREAAESLKARHELDAVHRFFNDARNTIESSITLGVKPPAIELGKSRTQYEELNSILALYSQKTPMDASHKYHFVWQEFNKWARDNGLNAKLEYAHDGVGMESWYVLLVTPA